MTHIQRAVDFFGNVDARKRLRNSQAHLKVLEEAPGLSAPHVAFIIDSIVSWTTKHTDTRGICLSNTRRPGPQTARYPQTAFGLPLKQSRALIHCLVPKDQLDSRVVISLTLWALGNLRDLHTSYAVLPVLQWVHCLLRYNLCSAMHLQPLYEVFFTFLNHDALVPVLCSILSLLTSSRSSHLVTRRRVSILLRLSRCSELVHLLARYQQLRPELVEQVPMPETRASRAASACPLTLKFHKLCGANGVEAHGAAFPLKTLPMQQQSLQKRKNLVPPLEYPAKKRYVSSRTLFECANVQEMLDHISSLPAQAMSLLNSIDNFAVLVLSPSSRELQERLSITLSDTLTYHFLSGSAPHEFSQQNLDLLCRINILQDWFQESLPVVNRFLSRYLEIWNGKDYFLEVLRMMSYVRIANYDEIECCIMTKLISHFDKTFSASERLIFLTYTSELIKHWINLEYPRAKGLLPYNFLAPSDVACFCPLQSISELIKLFQNLTEIGMTKFAHLSCVNQDSSVKGKQRRFYRYVYTSQVLGMFSSISRSLIKQDMPIIPHLPQSVIYLSLFSFMPCHLSRLLDFLAAVKHEHRPLCQRRANELKLQGDDLAHNVAIAELETIRSTNRAIKDVLATLSVNPLFLERGESLFRRNWDLEDEEIRKNLNVINHPALLSYLIRFLSENRGQCCPERQTRRRRLSRSNLSDSLCDTYSALLDDGSNEHSKYLAFLSERLPQLMDALESFQWRIKNQHRTRNVTAAGCGTDCSIRSLTTSGVSSLRPTVRTPKVLK